MKKNISLKLKITLIAALILSAVCLFTACDGGLNLGSSESSGSDDAKTYTVTFVAVDGQTLKESVFYQKSDVKSGTILREPAVVPENYDDGNYIYSFLKWRIEGVVSLKNYEVKSDVTVQAAYMKTPKVFTLEFCDDLGKVLYTANQSYGSKVIYNFPFPVKTSDEKGYRYVFSGFNNLDETTTVTGNMRFNAIFVKEKMKYTVTYYDFRGDISYTETYEYGATLNRKNQADERKGYKFDGYNYFDESKKIIEGDEAITVEGNISVKQKWSEVYYNVNYIVNQTAVGSQKYSITSETFEIAKTANYEGCKFLYWVDEKGNRVDRIIQGSVGMINLYAKFEILSTVSINLEDMYTAEVGNSVNLRFIVMFDGQADVVYRWYKNGALIENANSITLTIEDSEENGSYHCVATIDVKGIGKKEVSSSVAVVRIGTAKECTVVFDINGVITSEIYEYGSKIKLPSKPTDYIKDERRYGFSIWQSEGKTIAEGSYVTDDMTVKAKFVPYYFVDYYLSEDSTAVVRQEIKEGYMPTQPQIDNLPSKLGYMPSWNIDFDSPVMKDTKVYFKLMLENDIVNFLEQSLSAVFDGREMAFTISSGGALAVKVNAIVKINGLSVGDLHGVGKDFSIDELLNMIELKVSMGSANAVKIHFVDKTLYVSTVNGGTFKITYKNLAEALEGLNIPELNGFSSIILNMVDFVDMTAETVSSITFDSTLNKLTILPKANGTELTLTSDFSGGAYYIRNINFSYYKADGTPAISANCDRTDDYSPIVLSGEESAANYDASISELIVAAMNLYNGRHFNLGGNVTLSSPKADITFAAQIDRYEKGEADEYGQTVNESFSTFHITLNIPKISMVVSIVNAATKSEIFVDTRFADKVLFKRTVGNSVEYKSIKDFDSNGTTNTMALVTWLMNLGSIVDSFAGSQMNISVDIANILKSVTYADSLTTVVIAKNAIAFSDDNVAINKDITLGLKVANGYPEKLTVSTGMSLAGILKPDVNLNLNFDRAATADNINQKTQSAFDDLKNNQFAALFAPAE